MQFAVLPGDLSHLDNVYINRSKRGMDDDYVSKQDELYALIYDDAGNSKVEWVAKFPRRHMRTANPVPKVITVGFMP